LCGSAPGQACCERTSKKYAHSSGSVPTKDAAVRVSGSRSQRKEMVADLRRVVFSFSFCFCLSLSLSLSVSLSLLSS
jgi:hypothetical protein